MKTWLPTTGGSWATAANWSGGTAPAAGDSIVIPDLAAAQTITFDTTVSVAGVQSGETISITGGTPTNPGNLSNSSTAAGTRSVDGGTYTAGGTNWTNAGTLALTAGVLNLGGSFTTAAVTNFTRTGGAVNLTGTLLNTGATLALTAATGSWAVVGGTIDGGW